MISRVTTHAPRGRTVLQYIQNVILIGQSLTDGRALKKNEKTANVTELDDGLYTRRIGTAGNGRVEGR